jgi:hypothetical protein
LAAGVSGADGWLGAAPQAARRSARENKSRMSGDPMRSSKRPEISEFKQ